MKILQIILSALEIAVGIIFLVNTVSDIQAGFGLVLLAVGLNSLISAIR